MFDRAGKKMMKTRVDFRLDPCLTGIAMKRKASRYAVPYWQIEEACFKLNSISHLLQQQRDGATIPSKYIMYGLGAVLREIHDGIMEVVRQAYEDELQTAGKKRRMTKLKRS